MLKIGETGNTTPLARRLRLPRGNLAAGVGATSQKLKLESGVRSSRDVSESIQVFRPGLPSRENQVDLDSCFGAQYKGYMPG
jgi:hypothetical protein